MFDIPKINVLVIAVSCKDPFVFGPAFKAIYFAWVYEDLLHLYPMIRVMNSSTRRHAPAAAIHRALKVLGVKLKSLSRDVNRPENQEASQTLPCIHLLNEFSISPAAKEDLLLLKLGS
jgi:hypothetical protein